MELTQKERHLTMTEWTRQTTEQQNRASMTIDTKSTREVLSIINNEDKKVALAVEKALPEISALVETVCDCFYKNGRLFYVGAGTSGRLGVLDASECPPTYGTDPESVQGIIAGGNRALTRSVEGAEDDEDAGMEALINRGIHENDIVIGITASGQAPFVIGAMKQAKITGAAVGAIGCNYESRIFRYADHAILLNVGPEIVAGSTRMKAGTAQKMVLNMITTASMIKMGKVYGNLMVDLTPVNQKLVKRSIHVIRTATGCDELTAEKAFTASEKKPKIAIVMILMNIDKSEAEQLLEKNQGRIGMTVKGRLRSDG